MTEEIRQIINEIRQKSHDLHQKLIKEREASAVYLSEKEALLSELETFRKNEQVLREEISALQSELEMEKNRIVEVPPMKGKNEEEIDELVKEIEYCINQLKEKRNE